MKSKDKVDETMSWIMQTGRCEIMGEILDVEKTTEVGSKDEQKYMYIYTYKYLYIYTPIHIT